MKTITDHELSEIADDWAREMPIDIGRRASFAAGYRYAEQQAKNSNTLAVNSILNDYDNVLVKLTEQIESLEKIYNNLSHLKIKELNILRGNKSQLEECIEIIQKYYC